MIEQPGDKRILKFSFMSPRVLKPQISCWLTHSNKTTHSIVQDNLHRSPLYSGVIEGIGPRHCPSFEDKVVRFSHKDSHQVFLEPEGRRVNEFYVQGMNTSLPEDVQADILHSIPGMERVRIIRTGYAIEYDYVIPTQLKLSLECKTVKGLFTAGQINGTSGYEEAAAQGLIAGINAALQIKERESFILRRSEGYIGVLIDDLVTKGIDEPYRLLTSSAEYRLILRQDNADLRLTETGYQLGTVSETRYTQFQKKMNAIQRLAGSLRDTTISADNQAINRMLKENGSRELRDSTSLWQLLRRPEVSLDDIINSCRLEGEYNEEVLEQVEIECKYEGYIKKQNEQIRRFEALEEKRLADDLDYESINGLSSEGRYKLMRVKPSSVGQASRITGVSPADINVLLIHLEKLKRQKSEDDDR
jgi:tRNA uridine 5-carboxymethylaminomethyl modification enzyme